MATDAPVQEFIAPSTSAPAKRYIALARGLLYSDGLKEALQRAITGADYLADGAVPLVTGIIAKLQDKLGPLNDVDLHAVVVHVVGSLVDLAEKMGDPDVADKPAAVKDIVEGVMAMLSGKVGLPQAPQAPGMAPAPLMGSVAGG
jgi:hypothetical protein